MKKKSILIILLFFVVVIGFVIKFKFFKPTESTANSNADLTFAVLSDIHANKSRFNDAINDLYYNVNSEIGALVLNGDTVDEGLDEQYDDIKNVLDKNSEKLPDVIIKNMGNHEYYNYSSEHKTKEEVEERINKYLKFSGNGKIYHDAWVKGYHFISLGSDNNSAEKSDSTTAFISDEQINWLKKTIAEKYEQGKPIFVFLHQPLEKNFFNISVTMVDKYDEIKAILSNYPEVILFTSHTHITPNENFNVKNTFSMVNTGSVKSNYVVDENSEKGFREDTSYSNGLYVEVIGNKVTIKARNFKDNTWIYTKEISN